jgi:plasmid stabilization system protein ParE
MPRGDKAKYTEKQKRKAEHIEVGYEARGVPEGEAERRAWATVNKESGGGKQSGSGRGQPETHVSSRKGGRIGGAASASRTARGTLGLRQESRGNPKGPAGGRKPLTPRHHFRSTLATQYRPPGDRYTSTTTSPGCRR